MCFTQGRFDCASGVNNLNTKNCIIRSIFKNIYKEFLIFTISRNPMA